MSTDPVQSTSEPLQFDGVVSDAGTATPVCAECAQPIAAYYYEAMGKVVCASCKLKVERALGGGDTSRIGRVGRATLWGIGAALLGAVIYCTISIVTGLEIGLVSILIGFMVGWGVRRGSAGRGGRRYQVLAVGLTYLSILLAYGGMVVAEMRKSDGKPAATASADSTRASTAVRRDTITTSIDGAAAAIDSASRAASGENGASAATSEAAAAKTVEEDASGGPLGVLMAIGFFLFLPIVANVMNMPSGVLGLIIIGIGLRQAWQMNAGVQVAFSGPFKVGSRPAPAA